MQIMVKTMWKNLATMYSYKDVYDTFISSTGCKFEAELGDCQIRGEIIFEGEVEGFPQAEKRIKELFKEADHD